MKIIGKVKHSLKLSSKDLHKFTVGPQVMLDKNKLVI